MKETNTLLEVKNLVVEFKTDQETVRAVEGISFTLNKGETVGIVGESGSGKSITSLSVMKLIPTPPGKIVEGEILYHSKNNGIVDLVNIDSSHMRKYRGNEISMIFQEPMTSLNPVFTCGNQVIEAIMLHQNLPKVEAKFKAIELFEKVELPRPNDIYKSYPHQLSGGQKQRVMIAIAMSCNPSILIADEPTTALDVTVQKTILELMGQLQLSEKMGIMFITHDLGVIAELASKVIVMYKGKIVEQGDVLDIFTRPQHSYTKGLLACRPPLNARYHYLPVVSDFMTIDPKSKEVLETNRTVSEVIAGKEITESQRKEQHEKIYKGKEPVMKIEHLKTYFPLKKSFFGKPLSYVKAVDDVSFDVYEGETLGLVGESGCGKTTLGRTILKLIKPTSGKIIFEGKDITDYEQNQMRELRKKMQIIFQDPYSSLNPRITVGESIMEPLIVHKVYNSKKECRNKVYELLERVSLKAEHFNRYPHEFSGGQRQRICIARSLVLNPKFIVCDESVSALDVSVQAQVLNLLNELKKEFNFTYIFISHDLSVVKFMSDRMIVMSRGKIEEMGMSDDIYKNPKSPYTKKLIDAIPTGGVDKIRAAISVRNSNIEIMNL